MGFFLERIKSVLDGIERAKINRNFDKIEKNFNSVVDVVSNKAYQQVVDSAKLIWQEPVDTFADLATTYPRPGEGWASMTRDTGIVYRYNSHGQWKPAQEISAGPFNEMDNRLTAQLAQTVGIDIAKYKHLIPNIAVTPRESWDWTEAIKAAVQEAFDTKIGVVIFPHGTYLTDPLSFNGYHGVTLMGVGLNHAWGNIASYNDTPAIKFKSAGAVGLQFADTTNPSPTWNAPHCRIEGLTIDGNNLVNTCVNGNYDFTINKCRITNAKYDGVTMEDLTYPFSIDKSEITLNGRHGIYTKGPRTTVYTIYRTNIQNNGGYAMYIEGGAHPKLIDLTIHSNMQGGIKINRRNDLYTNPAMEYWLNGLIFDNVYFEQNGKYDTTDERYEGNYALVITRTGNTHASNITELREVTFRNCALHRSDTGKSYKIDAVYGLTLDKSIFDHANGTLNGNYSYGLDIVTVGATVAFDEALAPYPFVAKYHVSHASNSLVVHKNGGTIGQRGRIQSLPFTLSSITAGGSMPMILHTNGSSEILQGYPITKGSIVGIKLFVAKSQKSNASVSGKLKVGLIARGIDDEIEGMPWDMENLLELDLTQNRYVEYWFAPLSKLVVNKFFGVRVNASADYTNPNNPTIHAYLLIEE